MNFFKFLLSFLLGVIAYGISLPVCRAIKTSSMLSHDWVLSLAENYQVYAYYVQYFLIELLAVLPIALPTGILIGFVFDKTSIKCAVSGGSGIAAGYLFHAFIMSDGSVQIWIRLCSIGIWTLLFMGAAAIGASRRNKLRNYLIEKKRERLARETASD